ncbi:hypothetical protein NL529_31645, partial [Klebsiella pneumoniae]|nr:hypothetical protein [Klebsiella pneumoniae]
GPWARTGLEIAAELNRLGGYLDAFRAAEAVLKPGESLSPGSLPLELFCQGIQDTSAWTLGVTTSGPMHPSTLVVNNASVELTI